MSAAPELSAAARAALHLAEECGLAVFPCRPDKRPYTFHGFQDATIDTGTIECWWRRWPDALIGVPTGKASGIVVLDIDPDGLGWYQEHSTELCAGRIHRTRRDGYHLLFRMPAQDVRNSASQIAPGIDVRAEGGYVVWWPAHGCKFVGDLSDIAEPPNWLLEHLTRPQNTEEANSNSGSIPPGSRNDFLSREAYRLRKQGASIEQILTVLLALNAARCSPPLDDTEVRQIADGKARVEAENDDPESTEKKATESQASVLVAFVRDRCKLVHDENGEVYAIENATGEVRNIERRAFKVWLHAEFYKATEKAARSQSVAEALTTLAGVGLHDGDLVDVHIRCAALGDGYVIDLGEPGKSRAIVVRPGSWTVTEHHGLMFVRPDNMKPLPEPVGGGTLEPLWSLVNVPENARLLVLTWLLECLRPDTPFPLLEAIGEQGSAKSGLQKLLKVMLDPSSIELRSAPRGGEDVFVGAGQGWLLAYDNVSHLSAELQDVLCRVATGATFATRKLYTNAEEAAIRAKRPVTLNGIGAAVTAQDLIDRAISLELPMIEDRRESGAIESEFERLHPELLGALLDIFARALALLPAVRIERDRRPRLIEYARLGCAVAAAMGRTADDFLAEFEAMRAESIGRTLDASPVAGALLTYLEGRPDRHREYTVKGLFESLTRPDGGEAWPRSPRGFADALRRAAPALRSFGVVVTFPGNRGGHARVSVTSKKDKSKPSHESHGSHGRHGQADGEHDMHDIHDVVPASISAEDEDQELLL
ncbi:MAG: bifunctional DNA primase/polymerase [Pseudomonadota bacterium]|jgi:hypothetical protein|nr:bifunctional DNA primase/polymerase [Pseudomonadota bacterium]